MKNLWADIKLAAEGAKNLPMAERYQFMRTVAQRMLTFGFTVLCKVA